MLWDNTAPQFNSSISPALRAEPGNRGVGCIDSGVETESVQWSHVLKENVHSWFAENPNTPNGPFQPGCRALVIQLLLAYLLQNMLERS